MVSFRDLKDSYERNWANLQIRPGRADEAHREATRLLQGKTTYQQVEARTGVHWWFVGLCHYRESHYNFDTYLGNGEPLGRVTTIVPKGRGPFVGPNAFVDGAVDALRLEGFLGSSDWSIARTLFRLEGFNGFGYHGKGVNSPYLYGGSNIYGPPEERGGKFIRDHVFDSGTVDTQLGTAVVLKALMALDPSIDFDDVRPAAGGFAEPATESDDELAQTVLLVQQTLNKIGADPRLAEDGKNGPRTKAAISRFQHDNGLTDTGLPDAATIAAITRKSQAPAAGDPLLQVLQRLKIIENNIQSSTTDVSKPSNDPVNLIERLLAVVQKTEPTPVATPSPAGLPNVDQLKKVVDLLSAVIATGQGGKPLLGQVNGALGETLGGLLNGKKTGLGIGGALLTSLLSSVPAGTGLGQVLTSLTPALGLSQFTMPIFLAMTAWGVLGKFEKWNQGTAPPPK
jgi:lysozyme family protein/peptidoglycan hydrolase-like protein with peptidoglycan-binding domain